MKMTIRGLRALDFEDEKGNSVVGVQIHGEYKDPDIVGVGTKPLFVKAQALANLGFPMPESGFPEMIGKTLDLEFNRYGKVQSIVFAK